MKKFIVLVALFMLIAFTLAKVEEEADAEIEKLASSIVETLYDDYEDTRTFTPCPKYRCVDPVCKSDEFLVPAYDARNCRTCSTECRKRVCPRPSVCHYPAGCRRIIPTYGKYGDLVCQGCPLCVEVEKK